MSTKVLAILAALFLVGAFALATLAPENMPLGAAIEALSHDFMRNAQALLQTHGMTWLWEHLVHPAMVRPAWLVPASLGLICVGVAATLSSKGASRSHRRRS